jgi:hypothetical protein
MLTVDQLSLQTEVAACSHQYLPTNTCDCVALFCQMLKIFNGRNL